MKIPFFLVLFAVLLVPKLSISQNLNEYKYVIVPIKYDFLNENDKYQLNSLTEYLFEKNGFTAILEGAKFPEDLKKNRCSALTAEVTSDSGTFAFVTKVRVALKNCNQQIVFKSKEGRSRLKKYKFAYQEALRDAFSSLKALNHSYAGASGIKEKKTIALVGELPTDHTGAFEWNNQEFLIQKKGEALVLKKREGTKAIAFLNETSKGNFVFRSDAFNGTAYFDDQGNLVVEYFDEHTSAMKKHVYMKK